MYGVAGPKAPVGKYGQPVAPNLAVRHLCPNCQIDPPNIIEEYSHGDLVCADCGTILGDRIVDTRSECDEGGDDPSRVGGPSNPLLGNATLETSISARDGRTGISRDLQRAQSRANQSATGPGGRATQAQLQAAFGRISEMCDAMQLPRSVVESAQHVYVIADEAKVAKGKNDDSLVAACIIYACRASGAERSFREVTKVTKVSKSELGRVFGHVRNAVMQENQNKGNVLPVGQGLSNSNNSAEGLLGRFSNYLDLGTPIFNASKHIATAAVAKAAIDGRSPLSIAAGVLYFTTILFETSTASKDIADIAGVSESTIKLICKKVAESLDAVIRPEWKTAYPSGYAALAALGKPNTPAASKSSRAGTPSASSNGAASGTANGVKASATPSPEDSVKAEPNGKADQSAGSVKGAAPKPDTKA
ncbi:Transcription initiation factor IIB [Vanrija pseudolonga]|uniref:Transcription initiation factor IIB n=1 Tax=Vanrija pseudolonga TaxID=143232 RepID=A0AAF0Y1Z7_9TREE|nr:Transcription initiation factor IIB [Vanrija pseudolonga]WOO78566.1 Transcription initiation factor IIB [Vanrija pseudolonga]